MGKHLEAQADRIYKAQGVFHLQQQDYKYLHQTDVCGLWTGDKHG